MLTSDKKRLSVFENGIVIDQKLPKWKNIEIKNEGSETKYYIRQTIAATSNDTSTSVYQTDINQPFVVYGTPDDYVVGGKVNFDEIAAASLKDLTILIKSNKLNNILSGYGGMHGYNMTVNSFDVVSGEKDSSKKGSFLSNLVKKLTTKKEKYEFDAVDFFTNVKLTSKASAQSYVDRISKYLIAIHNANNVGQTALVETLLKSMIANKYESLLYSEGYYYVVTEQQVVEFAKKTEKGLSLTYIKNYARPLPQDVVDTINKMNELCVFDNYVILHYDPKGETYKETEKEVAKRKDPILFGVIAGSDKLYYITDWVDETCDLTLEKFVDTLGITKENLLMEEEINIGGTKTSNNKQVVPKKKKSKK